jgi:hypothetical protein
MGVAYGVSPTWWRAKTDAGRIYTSTQLVVQDGLVLNLDAGASTSYPGSGTIWTDLSGQGNNANLISGPTFNSANGGSIVFDGTDDYADIGQPAVSYSPNKWTICVWLKPNNQNARFLTPQSAGIDQWLGYDAPNQAVYVQITELADINNRSLAGATNSVPIGQWTYSCVSIDNLNVKIYANGVLINEYTETISIANWSGSWIIAQRGNGTNFYSGAFSNFMVYNRALTAAEIQQNYNALKPRFVL